MKTYPDPSEVLFLRADINYTHIILNNGRSMVFSTTLKKVCQHYPGFFRACRSYALNPEFITFRTKKEVYINQYTFKIARRRQ